MVQLTEHDLAYADNKNLHYVAAGPQQGPLIIFVHGWPALGITWKPQLEFFASLGFRAVAPDLPGHGKSTSRKVLSDSSMESNNIALVALLSSLNQPNAIWVAHDWGAGVLSTLARTRPHLIRAATLIAVPYATLELGLDAVLPHVDREIYPADRYPYGQWSYQIHYERSFDSITSWYEADTAGFLKWMYYKGRLEAQRQPARTADYDRDGGPMGGPTKTPRPPAPETISWDATTIGPELWHALTEAYARTGFFGTNALYMNHKANREYNDSHAVNGGKLDFPVLFIHALNDGVCATYKTTLPDAQRRLCSRLTETAIDSGHWVYLEKPEETNAALARWLVEEVKDGFPFVWSNPFVKVGRE